MSDVAILLVSCCLEESRHALLQIVVDSLSKQCPDLSQITVFDNASTVPDTLTTLRCFSNVYRADRNIGYWSAIDWWLTQEKQRPSPPRYTYVIESDMVHVDWNIPKCASFLDRHPELGAIRLHEYSVNEMHLYDKEHPVHGSRKNHWQTHTNRATNMRVKHTHVEDKFWSTNFLTQLPAFNRFEAMVSTFDKLKQMGQFTEHDFQVAYHQHHSQIALYDGGIFHCNLAHHAPGVVNGSWTPAAELEKLGYQQTRFASIVAQESYTVSRVL